jgi:hypothetical protein
MEESRMRAFRPSRFSPEEEYDEDSQRIKDANLERYTKRAEKGTPLFERVRSMADIRRAVEFFMRD